MATTWDPWDRQGLAENPTRRTILELVRAQPGITYLELLGTLRRCTGVSASLGSGTLGWHLSRLERGALVASHRSGRSRRFYPSTGPWHADLKGWALAHSPARLPLIRLLVQTPGLTARDLLARLPTRRSAAGIHLQLSRLEAAGLLEKRRQGRCGHYFPTPTLLRAVETLGLAEPASDASAAVTPKPWQPPTGVDPNLAPMGAGVARLPSRAM